MDYLKMTAPCGPAGLATNGLNRPAKVATAGPSSLKGLSLEVCRRGYLLPLLFCCGLVFEGFFFAYFHAWGWIVLEPKFVPERLII